MAAKGGEGVWTMNSIILKFLFLPFRWAFILFIVILVVFGTSILTQGYLNTTEEFNQELAQVSSFAQNYSFSSESDTKTPINIQVSGVTYKVLDKVFFDITGINQALKAETEEDPGYSIKVKLLVPNQDILKQIDSSLKMVSLRIGYIAWFCYFAVIVSFVALVDGLVARAIRQKNASRESAGMYHRAKYWRSGILWLSIAFYLAWPISISPFWLFIPSISYALLVWLQAKYLKKYL